MPPLYIYSCDDDHETEIVCTIEARPDRLACPDCGASATRKMCAPALHTLATFSAGIGDEFVQRSRDPGDGSYFDPNLCNPETGQSYRITSKRQREEVIKSLGLFEKPPSEKAQEVARDKARKPIHFVQ